MLYRTIILKDGQVTIPAAIRKQLGLKPGHKVRQSIESGKILLEFDLPSEPEKHGDRPERED